jgi:hypothetical protein
VSRPLSPDPRFRQWLAERGPRRAPDELLARIMGQVRAAPQQRGWLLRWPVLRFAVPIAAGLVIVATVVTGLLLANLPPPVGPTGTAPVSSSTESASSREISSATAAPSATLSPSLPPEALDPGELGWLSVVSELDPRSQEIVGHWLATGTLDSADPAWFEPLVETPWAFDLVADQQPVVDGPTAGEVLFVSDDGSRSEIRLVDVHGARARVIGATQDVVFTARLTPDGASAYIVLLDRSTGEDRGVFRVDAHGDGSLQRVMDPPAPAQAQGGGIRLAAVAAFIRKLRVSADGSELARWACGEPFGCAFDVQQLSDATTAHYSNAGPPSDLVAVGDGYLLGSSECSEHDCVTHAIDLAQGTPERLAGEWPVVDARGHLVLLSFGPATEAVHEFSTAMLDGSGSRRVFATEADVRPLAYGVTGFEAGQVELPSGWVAVLLEQTIDGTYHETPAAVRLADGGWVQLTLPTIFPIGGAHD